MEWRPKAEVIVLDKAFKIFYNIGVDIKYYLEVAYEQSRAPQKVGKNV